MNHGGRGEVACFILPAGLSHLGRRMRWCWCRPVAVDRNALANGVPCWGGRTLEIRAGHGTQEVPLERSGIFPLTALPAPLWHFLGLCDEVHATQNRVCELHSAPGTAARSAGGDVARAGSRARWLTASALSLDGSVGSSSWAGNRRLSWSTVWRHLGWWAPSGGRCRQSARPTRRSSPMELAPRST